VIKMKATITERKDLQGKDEKYPLVFDVYLDDGGVMGFSLIYKIKIEGDASHKEITIGPVKSCGMSSRDCLDDEDADRYMTDAHNESMTHMKEYIKNLFPEAEIKFRF